MLPGSHDARQLAVAHRARTLEFPSRAGPLLPALLAFHDTLAPGARGVVLDVVWQTAPTPDLARAFAPPPGGDKVRPIEGYEMQLEHAGFTLLEKRDVAVKAWLAERAVADDRGAARVVAWLVSTAGPEPS